MNAVMLFLAFLCFVVATFRGQVANISLVALGLAFAVGAALLPRLF